MGSAHCAVAFVHAVTTAFGEGLALWGAVGTVSGKGLAWGAVGTVSSQGLALWSAVGTVFSHSLALWSAVRTVFSQTFFFQAITSTFSDGLAVDRMAVPDLRGGLFGGWQCESSRGQQ